MVRAKRHLGVRQDRLSFFYRQFMGTPTVEEKFFTARLSEGTEEEALAWQELRGEVLADWIDKRPGTRPPIWWKHDSPEPTRRVLRGHDTYSDPDTPGWARRKLSSGVIRCFGPKELERGVVVETEAAFLARHGLLSDEEHEALGSTFAREETLCSRIVSGPSHKQDEDNGGSVPAELVSV